MTIQTTLKIRDYAWMSQASYLDFHDVLSGVKTIADQLQDDTFYPDSRFTQAQATTFTDPTTGYSLVSQQPDKSSGFSATLFQAAKDGTYTLTHGATWQLAFSGGSIDLGASLNQGDLGLRWIDAPVDPATTLDINGDLAPIDFDAQATGVQTQTDGLDNIKTNPATPEADRADTLYDSEGNDHISSGGGNDVIYAIRGGDDVIEAGSGRDRVLGGAKFAMQFIAACAHSTRARGRFFTKNTTVHRTSPFIGPGAQPDRLSLEKTKC